MTKKFSIVLFILFLSVHSFAQLSGDLQTELDVYQRDTLLPTPNSPSYNNQFAGITSWLTVNYGTNGFYATVRFDLFLNSTLFNPLQPYTGSGIGFWSLSKDIGKLNITGGNFYDQFGSGITFRAFEDRGLGIDYAVFGLRLKYQLTPEWNLKVLGGQQKNFFSTYKPIILGACLDGNIKLNDKIKITPGVSFVNRILDQASWQLEANAIGNYPDSLIFTPKYNSYAFSVYNTLYAGDFSWYAEVAGKTREAILGYNGYLNNQPGNVEYTSLSYSRTGLGITAQFKRTDDFVFRTSANETLLQGVLDFIPPLTRQNTFRLLTLFTPATQYLGEMAYEGDLIYSPKQGYALTLNYSNVHDLNNVMLYQEMYGDFNITKWEKTELQFGVQNLFYNQGIYQNEPETANVKAVTPFVNVTYKISDRQSLTGELQYQFAKQDYGQWIYGNLEYDIAPKWSFSAADMYNTKPNALTVVHARNYYNLFISFTENADRFSLSYVRQIDGINCSGGVCRYEPAFNGLKFTVTASF